MRPRIENKPSAHGGLTALLGALCFVMSAIEYMIPKPLPFMRLGISNLPLIIAADLLPLRWILVTALVKVIGMSVISGSLFSPVALFALCGSLAAALAMWFLRRLPHSWISAIGVSVVGAVASNLAQIFLATFLIFGEAARIIAPFFLGMGLVTGLALGVFTEHFETKSQWFARARGLETSPAQGSPELSSPQSGGPALPVSASSDSVNERGSVPGDRLDKRGAARASRQKEWEGFFPAWALATAGLIISLAFLFQPSLPIRAAMLLFFILAAAGSGKRMSPIVSLLVAVGIVAANLILPWGKLLWEIGPIKITEAALFDGIGKAITFEGLVLLSKACISPRLKLPGPIGTIVAKAFLFYDRILEDRKAIRPVSLIEDIDALMFKFWEEGNGAETAGDGSPKGTPAGLAVLGVAAALSLAALLPSFATG